MAEEEQEEFYKTIHLVKLALVKVKHILKKRHIFWKILQLAFKIVCSTTKPL